MTLSGGKVTASTLENWFARHDCAAALVRPDHYIYGVAQDSTGARALVEDCIARLSD